MIKEIKFVSIIKVLTSGASTKPLVIVARDETGAYGQYVVKLYKSEYVENNFSVAKEILISELSMEFNLSLPNYAIINFDHNLLKGYYQEEYIKKLHVGYKFCTEYTEGWAIYNPIIKSHYLKPYDVENVFAFDNLVINLDRGGTRRKPNLLINNQDFLLIDHEQTFPFYDIHVNASKVKASFVFKNYLFDLHIFYDRLRTERKKDFMFDEFIENVRMMDLSFLDVLFKDFNKYEIRNGEKSIIFAYLNWFKNNPTYLKEKLLERVS